MRPILEVLVGKTMEQALLEVAEEEELAALREQQVLKQFMILTCYLVIHNHVATLSLTMSNGWYMVESMAQTYSKLTYNKHLYYPACGDVDNGQ